MFKSEKQLSKVVKKKLANDPGILFSGKRNLQTFVASEFNIGRGIADIVISFHKKVKKRSQPLTLHDLNVLNIIGRSSSATLAEIEFTTRTSSGKIKKSIQKLEKEKLISQRDEQVFSNRDYVNYQAETFAIEVKLKNWKRALEQAYRYRSFAFQSYVFLDRKFVDSAIKNKELFTLYNIGLASVSKVGEIEIHFKPKRSYPFDEKLNRLLNETIVNHHLSCKKVSQVSR